MINKLTIKFNPYLSLNKIKLLKKEKVYFKKEKNKKNC